MNKHTENFNQIQQQRKLLNNLLGRVLNTKVLPQKDKNEIMIIRSKNYNKIIKGGKNGR